MGRTGLPNKVLAFSVIVETATGLAAIADPALVVRLLLGADSSGVTGTVARCFGIAILGLGMACWQGREGSEAASPFRAMLLYNALIALYLAYVGSVGRMAGPLLWPAVVLHAVVALLLAVPRRVGSPGR